MASRSFAARALARLERDGILLLQDAELPSLATLVAGEPISGSWWGHSAGHAIFNTANELADHADVLVTKLVSGKVTFVHRRLWPALVAVGSAREPWQMNGLTPAQRKLLERVDREGAVDAKGPDAKALERRLLVWSRERHTESGAHALELVSWERLARARRISRRKDVAEARAELEKIIDSARLPWVETKRRGGRSKKAKP